MKKFNFDLIVNPKGHPCEFIVTRKGKPLAYWDNLLKKAYCTNEAYKKNSPNVVIQAVQLAEKYGKAASV